MFKDWSFGYWAQDMEISESENQFGYDDERIEIIPSHIIIEQYSQNN